MTQGQELDEALRAVEDSAAQLLIAVRGLRDVLTDSPAPAPVAERPGAHRRPNRLPATWSGPGEAGYDMDR